VNVQSPIADRRQVRSTSHDRDIVAGLCQPPAEVSADSTGTYHRDLHRPPLATAF
jgi:hypothetical protein